MALANPYNQYRQQQVTTASPDKLLLMLYDGALRFCRQAQKALGDENMNEAHTFLTKAQKIIEELMVTLNMDYEIAHNLYSLYDYLYRRLVEANLKKDLAIIEEVVGFLTELRQAFAEAAASVRQEGKT